LPAAHSDSDRLAMLEKLGLASVEQLFAGLPEGVRLRRPLAVPGPLSETELKKHFLAAAKANANLEDWVCFLGAGVYDHYIPAVVSHIIQRSEFYTSYTPYQAEISQGLLQSIYEYQTMICRLTGMEVSNASLYDGATALAESVFTAFSIRKQVGPVAVSAAVSPFYRRVLGSSLGGKGCGFQDLPYDRQTGQTVLPGAAGGSSQGSSPSKAGGAMPLAVVVQHPNFFGCLEDLAAQRRYCDSVGALMITCVDPLALGVLRPPGDYGADIVVAEGQGLGCAMNFGGPLLGVMAARREHIRHLPGRLAGMTVDRDGERAFSLTLQTREQHIKRERATSNICTNQALCALAACVYLATLGEVGLRRVAEACVQKSHYAWERLSKIEGFRPCFPEAHFFKEFAFSGPVPSRTVQERLAQKHIVSGLPLGPYYPEMRDAILWCVTEKGTREEIDRLVRELAEICKDEGAPCAT